MFTTNTNVEDSQEQNLKDDEVLKTSEVIDYKSIYKDFILKNQSFSDFSSGKVVKKSKTSTDIDEVSTITDEHVYDLFNDSINPEYMNEHSEVQKINSFYDLYKYIGEKIYNRATSGFYSIEFCCPYNWEGEHSNILRKIVRDLIRKNYKCKVKRIVPENPQAKVYYILKVSWDNLPEDIFNY